MNCFISPKRTRSIFQSISFGAILLWILFGTYTTPQQQNGGVDGGGGARHLLSLYEREETELALNKDQCLALDMMTKPENGEDSGVLVNLDDDQCSTVHNLDSNFSTCDFIHCVDSCSSDGGLLDYLSFIYCTVTPKLIPLAMIVLFLWLIFLFIFLGATAEEYFCPALTVISSILRLSQNVAGVTLLALGNGAPDIFSAFAAVNQDEDSKASLAIGALFGAGIFVTTVVVGGVTVTKPFMLTQRPFLRDVIFYIFAAFWTFYLLWNNAMTIGNAVGFVGMYVFYVLVVIFGRVIFQKWKKWRKQSRLGTGDMPRAPSPPEGKEMGHSDQSSGLGGLGSLLPGVGLPGGYTQQQNLPGNGHISIQADMERGENDSDESDNPYPDTSNGGVSSTTTTSGAGSTQRPERTRPVILIQSESDQSEGSPLFPRQSAAEKRRQKELSGASLPPLLVQDEQQVLDSPSDRRRNRGASSGPHRLGYGAIPVAIQNDSGSRSPSPVRGSMRKTISGALDVTEGVGAVFGIPHVPELWDEVNRSHSRARSSSTRSRGRSWTKSALMEDEENEGDRAPLLGPTLTVPRGPGREYEGDEDTGSTGSDEDDMDNMAPVINLRSKKIHPFFKLLMAIWPFGESFKELGIFGKIYEIAKSPAGLLLTLTVPVIDTNEDDHNWNKWLSVLHCVTAPVFIALITKLGLINIGGVFPVWTLILIFGVILAIVVAFTSKSDKPPVYHCVFAWVGFAVAVVWIYSIANEIVNLLQAFGVVIKLSDGILGLTLLAWGNSIGDAVSNVTMAKQGFPRMAIGACFGGPLLNMLLGIGIASVVKTIRNRANGFQFRLIFTQVELLAALFLLASLSCTLVIVFLLKFRLRRPYGIFLVAVYVIFLTVAILAEVKVFQIEIPGVITVE